MQYFFNIAIGPGATSLWFLVPTLRLTLLLPGLLGVRLKLMLVVFSTNELTSLPGVALGASGMAFAMSAVCFSLRLGSFMSPWDSLSFHLPSFRSGNGFGLSLSVLLPERLARRFCLRVISEASF